MLVRKVLSVAVLGLALCSASLAAVVSTESLLDEMTDLKRLAELPDPAYTTKQFSSYDRGAKSPSENWFANGDAGNYLRVEEKDGRKEHVMMDIAGPGAIVRIWSANPAGTLRIYVDGADRPVLETPMKDLLGGNAPHLPRPIAGEYARGWNLYFPIPYAKHCKVTSDQGSFYYHVNYRTYANGTEVKSFTAGDLAQLDGDIKKLAKVLEAPLPATKPTGDVKRAVLPRDLKAGQEESLTIQGPRAIAAIELHMMPDNDEAAARAVILSIEFDGQKTVECPLGDFFGTAPGFNSYSSLPLQIHSGGKTFVFSRWFMPFAKQAKITVRNLWGTMVSLDGTVATVPYEWTEKSLLFHAKWRIEHDIPTRPFVDWTHLDCTGNGRFVGGALHLVNPVKTWWGEGDEKIYVDGEDFPSHFGTGTEDYYGYAWGSSEVYTHAYHNQPRCDGPGTYGHNSENRFHIIDDIPFTKSFKFDMENWHAKEGIKVTRAAVSYWYARPGGSDFFKPITRADLQLAEVPPFPGNLPGTIEGETLVNSVEENTGGDVRVQELGEPYSGDRQLRWAAGKKGARLVLTFESKKAGPRQVHAQLKKAYDFAIVQLYINGKKAGEPVDCYSKETAPTGELHLGAFDLKEGRNELVIEVTGRNPAADEKTLVGLDYIRIP
ncbi:MAG: hypothetical protein AMXMBFR13_16660 [Phycisphaerae bacterium]